MGAAFLGWAGSLFGSAAFATFVGNLARVVLINVIMGALQRSMNKRPPANIPPVNVTVRNPVEERRIIFGEVRVGGAIVFL